MPEIIWRPHPHQWWLNSGRSPAKFPAPGEITRESGDRCGEEWPGRDQTGTRQDKKKQDRIGQAAAPLFNTPRPRAVSREGLASSAGGDGATATITKQLFESRINSRMKGMSRGVGELTSLVDPS